MTSDKFFLTPEAREERSRCARIAEQWMSPAYVQNHFGQVGEFETKAIQKIAAALKRDIMDGVDAPASEEPAA